MRGLGCNSKRRGSSKSSNDMKKIGIATIEDCRDGIIPKKWGSEIIIHNDEDYCGKILRFNEGARFSMHFHMKKSETWFVQRGRFKLRFIDPETADELTEILIQGDVVEIPPGNPHQLIAIEEGDIFEVSTQHFDDDSYRIIKGDSQE